MLGNEVTYKYFRIILYAITGCIAGLFAVVIITGVGTLVYLVPPMNAHAHPR